MLSGLNVVFSWMSPSRRRMEKQLSEQLKLILLGSIEHQREPFHQKDIPCIITKLIILEDFIEGGSHRDQLDEATKERIDTAYKEMNEHVGLKWY